MTETAEQGVTKTTAKTQRSLALLNAEEAVRLWWQRRVYLRKNRVPPKGADTRPVPDVPDEFLRPESFIGPSTAKPDGVSAWGVESARSHASPGGVYPSGSWISLEIVSRDERDEMRRNEVAKAETLAITEKAMLRLGLIDQRYWFALEMHAAGYSERTIALSFKVERYVAKQWIECGLTWIAGCLIVKPDFSAGMGLKPRRVRQRDLWRTCRWCKAVVGHLPAGNFCSPACKAAYVEASADADGGIPLDDGPIDVSD